jgi:glycine betaine/proline transport system substrate-binding protein
MSQKGIFNKLTSATLVLAFGLMLSAGVGVAQAKNPIIFADLGWDSVQVHNRIAAFVIEHGLGYPVQYVQGETIMLNTALIEARGSQAPNVNMETWTENWQELYDKGKKLGMDPDSDKGFVELGSNFPNSVQGFWVPTYVVKGDKERGIEPTAPDLKTVQDANKAFSTAAFPDGPVPWSTKRKSRPMGWTKISTLCSRDQGRPWQPPWKPPTSAANHGSGITGRRHGSWASWT